MAYEIVADAVFDRIRKLYSLPSDAAMARHLGIFPQDVPRQRKSGNLPYKQILNTCPPEDWVFIFLGRRPADRREAEPLSDLILRVIDAGYRVEKKS